MKSSLKQLTINLTPSQFTSTVLVQILSLSLVGYIGWNFDWSKKCCPRKELFLSEQEPSFGLESPHVLMLQSLQSPVDAPVWWLHLCICSSYSGAGNSYSSVVPQLSLIILLKEKIPFLCKTRNKEMAPNIYLIIMKHFPRVHFLCCLAFMEHANSLKVSEPGTLYSYSEASNGLYPVLHLWLRAEELPHPSVPLSGCL